MATKKKPSTKITKQDQKDWQDFIKNIKSVEDKDLKDEKLVINNNFFFDIKIDENNINLIIPTSLHF